MISVSFIDGGVISEKPNTGNNPLIEADLEASVKMRQQFNEWDNEADKANNPRSGLIYRELKNLKLNQGE